MQVQTTIGPEDDAILKLLSEAPSCWTPLEVNTLTAVEERTLQRLTGAALVERRFTVRLSLIGHPIRLDVTATATGEYGLVEAMEPVLRQACELWADFYKENSTTGPGDKPRFFCEQTQPHQWRLTSEGVQAQQDLTEGHAKRVLDFVQKRTVVFYGLMVRGYGRAERIELSQQPQPPAQVEVINMSEVSGPLAQMAAMMEQLFTKLDAAKQSSADTADTPSAERGTRGPQRMHPHHAWRYLSTVQAWAEVQRQNKGKPQRQRESKRLFARKQGISVHELNAMLAWYRKYHKLGQFPADPQTLTRDQLDKLFA
ncbi:MAG: hypothetical protein GC162_00685 [Planctomycetes bacterium]|nr:hypothetical protein [Planctomycetota bacterium]